MAIKKNDIATKQTHITELASLPNANTLPSTTIDSDAASGRCVSSFYAVDEHGIPMPPAAIARQNCHQLTIDVVDEIAKVKNIMKEGRNGTLERSSLLSPKQGHLKLEPSAAKSEHVSFTETEDAVAERPLLANVLRPPLVNRPSLRSLHDQHLVENFLRQAESRGSQAQLCQNPGIGNQEKTPISPLVRQPSMKQQHSMHLVSGLEERIKFTESVSIQVELVLAMEMSEIAGKEAQVSSNQR